MKLIVFTTLVVCALAKPAAKTDEKRQVSGFFVPQYNQNVNQFGARSLPTQFGVRSSPTQFGGSNQYSSDSNLPSPLFNDATVGQNIPQEFPLGDTVKPELTFVGNSGLNSNGVIPSTTAAPSSAFVDSFNLPTSTISPFVDSGISSVNTGAFPLNSGVPSEILTQNLVSSVTPLPEISSPSSISNLDSFNVNPTAVPILRSNVVPSVQPRFSTDNILLNQGIDLSSFNYNGLNNYQGAFDYQSNLSPISYVNSDSSKAEVTKSVYFYEAPEEPQQIRQRKIVQLPAQKINYKLLFIKAPSAPEPQPIEIPAQVLNNEKTRVYVLVKKPETEQEVRVVAGPTPKPEKPEVFYIKYKTREEAEKAIKEAQAGAALGQESINVDSQQILSTIKDVKVSQSGGNVLLRNSYPQQVPLDIDQRIFVDSVQQKQPIPSVPLNLFESSTALPFISTTGAFRDFQESSTATPLLNDRVNQLSIYNTPVLSSRSNVYPTGNYFPSENTLYNTGNAGFRTDNLGTFGGFNLSPRTYSSFGISNIPSLGNFNQNSQFGFRSGRVDSPTERISSVALQSVGAPIGSDTTNSLSTSTEVNGEPFQINVGGSENGSSNSAFTNAAETSSTTESVEVESSTNSE
ncbi:hypothetical protein HHI36_000374 [Cryptolaemus montrouzieri]|uniref:DUF243 domain-containing protein n=1 Tax=Cryptolaemus montrouzieri TaxID=559131 RepID=A0ABD2P4H7_9CUCU